MKLKSIARGDYVDYFGLIIYPISIQDGNSFTKGMRISHTPNENWDN